MHIATNTSENFEFNIKLSGVDRFSVLSAIDLARIPNTMLGAVIALQAKVQLDWDWAAIRAQQGLDGTKAMHVIDVNLYIDEARALAFILPAALNAEPPYPGSITIPIEKLRRSIQYWLDERDPN